MNPQLQSPALNLHGDVGRLAADLVNISSQSHHERTIADSVENALRACGHLTVSRIDNNVIATNHAGRGERVILAGHLDTVPVNNNLPAELRNGIIYGLGACDMKGGVAASLHVAATVTDPNRDVTYIFYEAEEVTSEFNGLAKIGSKEPDFLHADFAVLMEPSNANIEAGCQGTIRFEVTTMGERAHSARSWMGTNAIHGAGAILRILNEYQPLSPVIDGLQFREGLNAVGITGGVAGNVIPDQCVVTINYRYAPDKTPEMALAHVHELFAGYDINVTDHAGGALPGLDHTVAQEFLAATGATVSPKFGWTDVARFAQMKTPAVNYGPGDPSIAHSQGEHVHIEEIERVFRTLSDWLTRVR